MTNDNSFQQVLSAIRNFYARYRQPISVFQVHRLMKNMRSKVIRNALIYLKSNNAITFDYGTGMIEPILDEKMREFIEAKPTTIDEGKIRDCIRVFRIQNERDPSPMEIATTFINMFGMANIETLTRFVRKMHEDGKLGRNDDFTYYLKETNPVGIRKWT